MVKTKHRIINNNFNFDVESYRNFKHKYEFSGICEMPIKWDKAKDFNIFDEFGNKWIDMTSGIFVTNAGHLNPNIVEKIDQRTPKEIISEIDELNRSLEDNLTKIKKML